MRPGIIVAQKKMEWIQLMETLNFMTFKKNLYLIRFSHICLKPNRPNLVLADWIGASLIQ